MFLFNESSRLVDHCWEDAEIWENRMTEISELHKYVIGKGSTKLMTIFLGFLFLLFSLSFYDGTDCYWSCPGDKTAQNSKLYPQECTSTHKSNKNPQDVVRLTTLMELKKGETYTFIHS